MNANVSKSNTGKLLVAVLAMAMIFAGAAIVFSDSEVNAVAPSEDPFDGMYVDTGASYDKDTGMFSVTQDTTITLTENIGSPTAPLDMYFSINAGKTLTITGNYNLYITNDVSGSNGFVVTMPTDATEADELATIIITGGTDAYFATNKDTAASGNPHVINGVNVTVSDGSTLTMSQSGAASSGVAYYDKYKDYSPTLTIIDSDVILDHAGGINAKIVMSDESTISVKNPKNGPAYISLNTGSSIEDSKIEVTNSAASQMGVQIQPKNDSTTTVINSAISITGNGIFQLANGAELTATGSELNAPTINVRGSGTTTATITDGTITGTINSEGNGAFTLNGTTLKNAAVASKSNTTITVGASGLLAEGNVNLSAATVTLNGNVVAASGSTVSFPTTTSGSGKVYALDGATVSGTTPITDRVTVTGEDLATFSGSGAILEMAKGDTIASDVKLSNGTVLIVNGILNAGEYDLSVENGSTLIAKGLNTKTGPGTFTGTITITSSIDSYKSTLGADEDIIITADGFVGTVNEANDYLEIVSGEVTVQSGTVILATNVPAGSTLNIMKGATVEINADKTVDGTVNQYGTIVSSDDELKTITVNEEGIYNALSGAVFKNVTLGGDGTINVSGAMIDAELTGVYGTDTIFPLNQNMVVSGTLTVTGQATLTIQGGLEIPAGTTVYIEEGSCIIVDSGTANVIIAGNLNVYETGAFTVITSKEVDISGTVSSEEDAELKFNAPTKLTGSASVTSMGTFTANNGLEIGSEATLSLQGTVDTKGIKNSGTITMDGASIAGTATINMAASGAVVNIYSVSFGSKDASLEITDAGLTVGQTVALNDNRVTIGLEDDKYNGSAIEGLVFTESVTAKTQGSVTDYVNTLQMSGNASVNVNSNAQIGEEVNIIKIDIFNAAHTAGETIVGAGVEVAETLNVDENIDIEVTGLFTVSGTVTLAEGVVLDGSQTTVTGKISAYEPISDGINAVYYRAAAEPRNIYTSLATAVADNSAATTKVSLEVMGTVIVSESVQVPATVNINGTGTLQIGTADNRGITVDIADGCDVRADAVVFATLHFFNDRNDRGDVVSDVTIENGNEITYTNVATALAGAQPGDVVTITGTDVTITSDLTVPAEVTLVVPLGSTVTVNDNVTLTVNGNLTTASQIAAETTFDEEISDTTSRLVVNGTFQTTETGTLDQLYTYYDVAGAYYIALTTTGQYKFIEPVAIAAESDATAIFIYGENTVGDIAFTGTETEPVTVTVMGAKTNGTAAENYAAAELNAGTVTLQYAALVVNGWFTGTVATAEGSVDAVNVTGLTAASTEVSADVMGMTVLGTVNQAETGQNVDDPSITIASGQVYVLGTANVNVDFEVAEGATLTITGSNAKVDADKVIIRGTLVAQESGNADITTIYVLGTFTVGAADTAAGVQPGATTVKSLYIGVDDEWNTYTGAVVNAESALGSVQTIYLAADNTVSDAQINGKKTTAYMVQDELYMTVYTVLNNVQINAVLTPVLDGVYADYWQYEKDGKVTPVAATDMVGTINTVSAYIVEDVYLVTFTIESGISDVYVDGDLVATAGLSGYYGNVYVMLPAGEHTVTYRLDNGFSGTVTMTINGQTMTDGKFTLSSDMPYLKDDVDYHGDIDFEHPFGELYGSTTTDFVVYNIVITGVEATGPVTPDTPSTGGDDSLGLTDYLLIVLVVLIVVMAIIVAIRLMRS